MSAMRYRSSNPDKWIQPRPHHDASSRYAKHGPIRPLAESPGLLRRLFRLH